MSPAAKKILEKVLSWPEEDQEELAEIAREIEARRTGVYVLTDDERAAIAEARKLENQLRSLRTGRSVAVLHYSPVTDTCEGEPREIFQYLGSQRLCEPIDRFDHVKAVVQMVREFKP